MTTGGVRVLRNTPKMEVYKMLFVGTNVLGLVVTILFVWLTCFVTTKYAKRDSSSKAVCSSPTCVRCRLTDDKSMLRKLRVSLKQFVKTHSASNKDVERVSKMIGDYSTKPWCEWTKEIDTDKEKDAPSHSVWVLKGLKNDTFWSFSELTDIYPSIDVLESIDALKWVRREFDNIHAEYKGTWKRNVIPQGKWEVFPLINQGAVILENAELCPDTMNLIGELGDVVMHRCAYGNVLFSVLYPGSEIEAHYGPCNFRLRCHLPLYSSPEYRLTVGKDSTGWREGEPLVFNDAYLHSVHHKVTRDRGGGGTVTVPQDGGDGETVHVPQDGGDGETVHVPQDGGDGETVHVPQDGGGGETVRVPQDGGGGETVRVPQDGGGGETVRVPQDRGDGGMVHVPRVVLIIDIWHPGVSDLECQAIESLFCANTLSHYLSSEH